MEIELTLEQWIERFKPIQNPLTQTAPYDNTMFETYGAELEFVKTQDARKIWTLLAEDDEMWISAGWSFVNRMGYFVTEEPFPEDDFVTVPLATADDFEEGDKE
jgi:hypothetical protein